MIDSKHRWVAALVALAGIVPPAAANEPIQRHERASSWRTVVLVEPTLVAPPRPVVRPKTAAVPSGTRLRPPVETASLQRPSRAVPAQPRLLGPGHAMEGIASYYWQDQMTSTGERFDKRAMTAAHRTLPFGTKVRVTHVTTGRSVIVRINDRGPFKSGRVIDLSEAAAQRLGMTGAGLAAVRIDVVSN